MQVLLNSENTKVTAKREGQSGRRPLKTHRYAGVPGAGSSRLMVPTAADRSGPIIVEADVLQLHHRVEDHP